jgi:hypothetical protein
MDMFLKTLAFICKATQNIASFCIVSGTVIVQCVENELVIIFSDSGDPILRSKIFGYGPKDASLWRYNSVPQPFLSTAHPTITMVRMGPSQNFAFRKGGTEQ